MALMVTITEFAKVRYTGALITDQPLAGVSAQNAARRKRPKKITDVNSYVVVPDNGSLRDATDDWQWTFVTIDTDDGLWRWGETSSIPRNASLPTGAVIGARR